MVRREDGERDGPGIASQDLHDYVEYLQDEKKKPTTVNKKIPSPKTYWKFLLETEKVETNPTRKLKMKNLSSLQDEPKSRAMGTQVFPRPPGQ